MAYACPLNFKQVDSNVLRISSLIVTISVITYFISSNPFILYFLALDFVVMLFFKNDYSPLYTFAQFVKKTFPDFTQVI